MQTSNLRSRSTSILVARRSMRLSTANCTETGMQTRPNLSSVAVKPGHAGVVLIGDLDAERNCFLYRVIPNYAGVISGNILEEKYGYISVLSTPCISKRLRTMFTINFTSSFYLKNYCIIRNRPVLNLLHRFQSERTLNWLFKKQQSTYVLATGTTDLLAINAAVLCNTRM